MFELVLTKSFASELKKLEKEERERIKKKLLLTRKEPFIYYARLTGHDLFRLRVGKYRIISQINRRDRKILLISVSLRKKSYRKL